MAEVEDYITYVIEKYTELFEQYNLLSASFNEASAKLEEYSAAEKTAESILKTAENKASEIISSAEKNAEEVSSSVSESCDILVEEYRRKVLLQTEVLCELKEQCKNFKNKLLHSYRAQLEQLNEYDFGVGSEKTDEELINEVLTLAKEHIKNKKAKKAEENNDNNDDNFSPVSVSEEPSFSDKEGSEQG